jgi:hypothetical protein
MNWNHLLLIGYDFPGLLIWIGVVVLFIVISYWLGRIGFWDN